jgi:ABC-type cobalamin/Fe3+-siderophores transport system ATPase subunit
MSGLRAQGLVVGRGAFRLGPFDLAAEPGLRIAVIGPNGGGKTTLLKTLGGLIPPLAGDLSAPRAAYLPPPGGVTAGFSALHLVALGRSGLRRWSPGFTPADRAAAAEALERLGIAALAERPFDRLSSGQQQLVLIARLFVQNAPLCLLDEPLSMLDPPHAARVEAALHDLAATGRIVIASTHSLAFAARADQVLSVGQVIRQGPPETLLSAGALQTLYGTAVEVCPCCGQPTT